MFYLYVVFRSNGTPCYVGKGKGDRWKAHLKWSHNKQLRVIFDEDQKLNPIAIIRDNLTETEAMEYEKVFIKILGRKDKNEGPLVNLTDGGEGYAGGVHSEETRKKQSLAHKDFIFTDEHRSAISRALIGRTMTPEWIAKRVAKIRGKPSWNKGITTGHVPWNKGLTGYKNPPWTEERKRAASERLKGVVPEAACAATRGTKRPRGPMSDEHKAAISFARKRNIELRKKTQ